MRFGYDKLIAEIYKAALPCFSIGKTLMGREIPAVKIGNGSIPLIAVGTHHAREDISAWFLIEELKSISIPEDITLYALPMLNIDGVMISENACPTLKANARGVDLNENYPALFHLKRSKSAPADEGFKGYYPASEPEVRALMDFTLAVQPRAGLTLHAKGEEILYLDTLTPEVGEESFALALDLAETSGYSIKPPSKQPQIFAAGYENWFRNTLKRPCLLIELAPYDNSPIPYKLEQYDALTRKARGVLGRFTQFYGGCDAF